MLEQTNHNPNIYEVVCLKLDGYGRWSRHYNLLVKPNTGDFLNLGSGEGIYEVRSVILNAFQDSHPPEKPVGTIYIHDIEISKSWNASQPYNIQFVYNPQHDIPEGSCEPREFELWYEHYFIVPRSGDIVLHGLHWYRVKDVLLSASGVYEIQVAWNAPK